MHNPCLGSLPVALQTQLHRQASLQARQFVADAASKSAGAAKRDLTSLTKASITSLLCCQ
jgi:hypothetical protein